MKIHIVAALAAMLPWLGIATVNAQYVTDQGSNVQQLSQRLDRYEGELQQLRSKVYRLPVDGVSYSNNLDADEVEKSGGLKEIDIQKKKNHKLRGRAFFDHIMFDDNTLQDRQNETGFDTARIGIEGKVYENMKYKFEVEFEGTEVDFKDVYVEIDQLPYAKVRAGHFKEPVSIEELTSSRFDTFMEQARSVAAFVPSRNFGIMAHDYLFENENVSWFIGTFRGDSDDSPSGGGTDLRDAGDWVFTSRVAATPIYDEPSDGRYVVHVGGAFSRRRSASLADFSTTSELGRQRPNVGAVAANRSWNLYQVEAATIWGPASMTTEFYFVDTDDGLNYNGGFIQGSYFLTGENRGYKRSSKTFDRVKPFENFFSVSTADGICRGRGAWELAARYSYVDLNAGGPDPNNGYIDGVTLGINWYLNPHSRIQFNWVQEDILLTSGAEHHANIYGLRWQVDW